MERTIARGPRRLWSGRASPAPASRVCGINPHAGENGLFGEGEEEREDCARGRGRQGLGLECRRAAAGGYALLSRAGAAISTWWLRCITTRAWARSRCWGWKRGVNITVGLPVIRTSVDHGTAFDIAGTGRADERSLLEAIDAAIALAPARPCGSGPSASFSAFSSWTRHYPARFGNSRAPARLPGWRSLQSHQPGTWSRHRA